MGERIIICRYCHVEIVCGGPNAGMYGSAWVAAAGDDPRQCIPSAPGHAPVTDNTQRIDRPGY
jgi:hypothetical protein